VERREGGAGLSRWREGKGVRVYLGGEKGRGAGLSRWREGKGCGSI
jgi:hypothetical protein